MNLPIEVISGIKENCMDSLRWEEEGEIFVRFTSTGVSHTQNEL